MNLDHDFYSLLKTCSHFKKIQDFDESFYRRKCLIWALFYRGAPLRFHTLVSFQSSTSLSVGWTPSSPDAGWTGCLWEKPSKTFNVVLPLHIRSVCIRSDWSSLDIPPELQRRRSGSELHHPPHRWRNRGLQRKRSRHPARHDCMHRLHVGAVSPTGLLFTLEFKLHDIIVSHPVNFADFASVVLLWFWLVWLIYITWQRKDSAHQRRKDPD